MPVPIELNELRSMDPFNAEWVTGVLLLVFGALAWTNTSSPRKWRLLADGMFSMRLGRQALREDIDLRDRTFLGLLLVASAIMALFLWQTLQLQRPHEAPGYTGLLVLVLAVLFAQAAMIRLVAFLAGSDRSVEEYLSTGLLLFILNGMLLLPVVVLLAYQAPWRAALMPVGLLLLGLLLIFRWVRGTWIGLAEGVPTRYIILYLCAAEVVPALLLINGVVTSTPLPSIP